MTKVEEKIALMELYDLYQNLLTKKQREYFEAAYFDDSSISEIADEFGVSRNAVHDQIKKTISKLNDFDEKLQLKKLSYKRSKIINKLMEVSKDDEITLLLTELKKVE